MDSEGSPNVTFDDLLWPNLFKVIAAIICFVAIYFGINFAIDNLTTTQMNITVVSITINQTTGTVDIKGFDPHNREQLFTADDSFYPTYRLTTNKVPSIEKIAATMEVGKSYHIEFYDNLHNNKLYLLKIAS